MSSHQNSNFQNLEAANKYANYVPPVTLTIAALMCNIGFTIRYFMTEHLGERHLIMSRLQKTKRAFYFALIFLQIAYVFCTAHSYSIMETYRKQTHLLNNQFPETQIRMSDSKTDDILEITVECYSLLVYCQAFYMLTVEYKHGQRESCIGHILFYTVYLVQKLFVLSSMFFVELPQAQVALTLVQMFCLIALVITLCLTKKRKHGVLNDITRPLLKDKHQYLDDFENSLPDQAPTLEIHVNGIKHKDDQEWITLSANLNYLPKDVFRRVNQISVNDSVSDNQSLSLWRRMTQAFGQSQANPPSGGQNSRANSCDVSFDWTREGRQKSFKVSVKRTSQEINEFIQRNINTIGRETWVPEMQQLTTYLNQIVQDRALWTEESFKFFGLQQDVIQVLLSYVGYTQATSSKQSGFDQPSFDAENPIIFSGRRQSSSQIKLPDGRSISIYSRLERTDTFRGSNIGLDYGYSQQEDELLIKQRASSINSPKMIFSKGLESSEQ